MSAYTDARSRPGAKGAAGTDDRQLWLTEFGGLVIVSYDEALDYKDLRYVKNITQGKADTFPIIGRHRDATEHNPGEQILGGTIDHDEVAITVDNILVDSVFIAEVDELLTHYEMRDAYAKQIGQSLGTTNSKRIAIMHILASRGGVTGPGQPTPAYYWAADLKTNAAKLEDAAFKAAQYLRENDMSGENPTYMLPHAQILLLSRYSGLDSGETTGTANRGSGTIGAMAGLAAPKGTNHIPKTAITTGLAKYQGDFSTVVGHISTKMAVGTLERRGMKMVMKEQEDRLGTIIIGSQLNGHGKLRNECSIELRTDAIGGRTGL